MSFDNIKVVVRVRPLNSREQNLDYGIGWQTDASSVIYYHPETKKVNLSIKYTFDRVFCEGEATPELYQYVAKNIITSAMDGFNGTIFAYGQTASGKTHTMHGSRDLPGIIPLSVRDIFAQIESTPDREFLLRVSYIEIYNEVIKDLLSADGDNLKIHEDINRGIFVGGLKEEIVTRPEQVFALMQAGEARRHVGKTNMNERSSRSHTIFRMVIESREKKHKEKESALARGTKKSFEGGAVKVSSLNLVDLAGSERTSHTGAEGVRLKEGGHINKSLLTLGTVIAKLSEGQEGRAHIPYRDSKLTRILQPALGGNNLTAIICTITPSFIHQEESLSTLKFASRAKTIKNKPTVNEVLDNETMLQRYAKEIHQLKQQLQKIQSNVPIEPVAVPLPTNTISDSTMKELELLRDEKQRTEEEKQRLHEKLEKLTHYIVSSSRDNKQARNRRQTWAPTSTMPRGLLSPTLITGGGLDFDNMDMIVDNYASGGGPLSPLAVDAEEPRVSKKRSRTNQEPAHDEHVAQMRDQIENLENEKASLLTELEGVIAQFRNKERNLIETQRLLEEAQNEMAQGSAAQSSAEVEELTQQLTSYVQREEEYQRRISEDSQQIKKLESDCATLKQQMKAAEEIKELLASDRSAELEAQSRMKSMQTTIDSQAQEIEGLKAQIKEAEEIHEEIEVKLAEESALTEERLQELQGQFADLEQQFDALQNENNALRVQCDEQAREFNFQLAQREEESLQGKKELEMVKANLSLSQSKVKNLQEENAKLSDELQAKAKAGQFDQSMLEEYTQAITEKESLKMELEELKRSANQSGEIEILREANDKLKIECEQKISNMKKQLDDRAALSRELSSSLQEMTSNYQAKIQETDAAQNMIKKLTDELNEIKSQAESARSSTIINDLKSELSQKKLDLADLANRLLAYEAEDKKRQHDILSKDNMTMDLQQKKENLEKQLSESRAEFQTQTTKQKEAIISLESSVAALNAQITVLTTDLATAKQQAEHAKREADDARALLANLEVDQNTQKALLGKTESEEQAIRKRVNQLQQSLDLAVQEKEKLHRQLKEEQEERKRLESRAYSMEQQSVEASSLNEKLEQLRAENTRLRHLEFVIEDNKRKYMLEKSELEGDIARLRGAASRLADMENENEALNKQINETKNRMRDMDNSIMAINNKYKDAEARYQELDSTHGRLKNRLKQVEDQLMDQEENGQKSQLETSDLKREISNLQSRLKGETERAESIESELRRVEKEKNELDMAITAYSAGVDSVNAQIQQLASDKMTLEHTLQQQIEQYNINVTDLNNARTTIVEMTNEMSQMRSQLKQTSTLLKDTEKNLTTAQKELQLERSEAEAAKAKWQSEFSSSKEELNKLRESEKQLKKELKQATQTQNSAEKEKDSKSKEIEKMKEKVQQLEGKLKSSNAENTALIAEKASLEREFKSSKSGHGVLEKENEKLKTSNKTYEQRNKELTAQMKDFEKQNEQLTKSLEKTKTQLDSLQKTFDSTKKELDGMKDNFQKVIEAKLDGDSRVGALNEDLSQRDAIINQLKSMLEEKERQFEEINADSLQLLESKNILEARLDELSAQHAQLQEEHVQMLANVKLLEEKVNEFDQHRSKLDEASIRLEQSEDEISDLKNKLKALLDEKEALSNQLINVSLEIDETKASCEEKIEKIESEKSDLIKQLKDRERSKQERDKRIEELMQKREIVEKAYDEQRVHFEYLVKDLQAQISQKDEQIENVRQSSEEEKARIEQEFKNERSRIENEMQSIVTECESTLVKKDEENKSVQEQFKTLADQLVLLEKEKEELNSLLATALEEKQKVAQIVQEEFVSKQKELEEEVEFLKGKVDTNLEAFNMQEQELKELSSMREKFDLLERERSGWEKKAEITEKKYRDLKGKLQAAHDKKVKQKLQMQSANKENVAFN